MLNKIFVVFMISHINHATIKKQILNYVTFITLKHEPVLNNVYLRNNTATDDCT